MSRCLVTALLVCGIAVAGVSSQDNQCYEKADILFVIDASSSIGQENFTKQLQFASSLVDYFQVGQTQFSFIRFDSTPTLIFDFDDYPNKASLKKAISNVTYSGGGTDTATALKLAREKAFLPSSGARSGVPKIVIVATDGLSYNPNITYTEAQNLKKSNVLVLAIGVGPDYNKKELEGIASFPEDLFEVINYDTLLSIVHDYSELMCIEARLFDCHNEADIYFLLDSSSKISSSSFQSEKTFVADLTGKLDEFQIGAATFGGVVKNLFSMGEKKNHSEIVQALSSATSVLGITDINGALKYVRDQNVFESAVGGRPNATKILVLLTDGGASSISQAKLTATQLRATGINIITVGVSNPSVTELQEYVTNPVLDVVTNLFNSALAAVRIDAVRAYHECKLPTHGAKEKVKSKFSTHSRIANISEACRIYNWHNGIHPHPYDCTKYIECTFLKTDIMSCAAGLGYDEVLQTCIRLEFVKSCNGSGSGNITQPATTPPPPSPTTPRPQPTTLQITASSATGTGKPCITGRLDVVLIFDSSDNVGHSVFQSELSFASNLAENFPIGPTGLQFSAVTFGTSPNNLFDFDTFSDFKALQRAILNAAYQGGFANTHLGLQNGRNLYDAANGARPGSPKLAIVFTSGRSADADRTRQQAAFLKQAGIYVIAVGFGNPDFPGLQDIASEPTAVFVNNFNSVLHAVQEYSDTKCVQDSPCIKGRLDILLVADSSDTVGHSAFLDELRFATNLAENFEIGQTGVQYSVVSFGSNPRTVFTFGTYTDYKPLQTAIQSATYQGGITNTHLALESGLKLYDAANGGRPGAPKVAVVFTSGRSADADRTRQQAALLKKAGIYVIAVGFENPDFPGLQDIASDPSAVFVNNFNGVLNAIQRYNDNHCYLDFVCTEIELADVIFVLDSSASIAAEDYVKQLSFVADVTKKFTLGPSDVLFGGVVFSQTVVKLFDLKDHHSHDTLKNAILAAAHLKSGTDTAQALNYVSDQDMFGVRSGGRANATKVLIILTDGRSNSMDETVSAAERLKVIGVKFIAIGIGDDIYLDELSHLASDNNSLFTVADFAALDEIKESVTRQTCGAIDTATATKIPSHVPDYSHLCASFIWADGTHPNPNDCSTYVVCQSLITYVLHCGMGEAFDPVILRCTDKLVAHRCDDPAYFGPTVTPAFSYSSTTQRPQVTSAPSYPSTTHKPVINVSNICAIYNLVDGIYPDPGSCRHFVECTALRTDHMECPEGLHYNTNYQVCDDVHDVDCNINFTFFPDR